MTTNSTAQFRGNTSTTAIVERGISAGDSLAKILTRLRAVYPDFNDDQLQWIITTSIREVRRDRRWQRRSLGVELRHCALAHERDNAAWDIRACDRLLYRIKRAAAIA